MALSHCRAGLREVGIEFRSPPFLPESQCSDRFAVSQFQEVLIAATWVQELAGTGLPRQHAAEHSVSHDQRVEQDGSKMGEECEE